jgi:hypothetical protein
VGVYVVAQLRTRLYRLYASDAVGGISGEKYNEKWWEGYLGCLFRRCTGTLYKRDDQQAIGYVNFT